MDSNDSVKPSYGAVVLYENETRSFTEGGEFFVVERLAAYQEGLLVAFLIDHNVLVLWCLDCSIVNNGPHNHTPFEFGFVRSVFFSVSGISLYQPFFM